MSIDVGTVMRACGFPGCPREFDIAAHMAGEVHAGQWHRNRLVNYLCPDHAKGEHVPNWELDGTRAAPVCTCSWRGLAAVNVASAASQWHEHAKGCA